MPHLSPEQKAYFKENGCLVIRNALTPEQVHAAQDTVWASIDADRNTPETWVEASPRCPVSGNDPAIYATVHETPLFAMMEEMVGHGQLRPCLLYTSPSPRDRTRSRMPSSA